MKLKILPNDTSSITKSIANVFERKSWALKGKLQLSKWYPPCQFSVKNYGSFAIQGSRFYGRMGVYTLFPKSHFDIERCAVFELVFSGEAQQIYPKSYQN